MIGCPACGGLFNSDDPKDHGPDCPYFKGGKRIQRVLMSVRPEIYDELKQRGEAK